MKKIIIVESPTKSKTIEGYMGKDYKVISSVGHIRDLATSGSDGLGIDIENNFTPNYIIIKGKEKLVQELKKECKGKEVYLATDPDREGEAISFHLAEVLGLDKDKLNRVEFHEITKPVVQNAFLNPRKINMDLVYSQETRRMLDRIIGFKVSKLLQNKIKSQSAGRVQSVALKLICDLENEITSFVPTAYYEVTPSIDGKKLKLVSYNNGNKDTIVDKGIANSLYNSLNKEFVCDSIETKSIKRESKPPFTTSTLQQEAFNKLNFSSSKTMSVAQKLYEGKSIGSEHVGLITYMRTDSTHLSPLFVGATKKFIEDNYGKQYVGFAKEKKTSLAQEAHEAIRPTYIDKTPELLKPYLTNDEYRLYKLIYNKAITSLMSAAKFNQKVVYFNNTNSVWSLTGQQMTFDGYTKVFGKEDEDKNEILKDYQAGNSYESDSISFEELFTKPKTRYTEATLIKDMDNKYHIGRPSTYATIMKTIFDRKYVEVVEKKLVPTEQGMITSKCLDEYFGPIINVKYTEEMEADLDSIAKGEKDKNLELEGFYKDFMPIFNHAKENMEAIYPKPTGESCPLCGKELVIRKGRYGEFVACSGFPKCKYIKQDPKPEQEQPKATNVPCPNCNKGYFIKKQAGKGKNAGKTFYACNNFPKCKTTFSDEPILEKCPTCGGLQLKKEDGTIYCQSCEKKNDSYVEIKCPKCNKGYLIKKLATRGKNQGNYFYSCNNFPRCKTLYNQEPTNQKCPKCNSMMLKDENGVLVCSNDACK